MTNYEFSIPMLRALVIGISLVFAVAGGAGSAPAHTGSNIAWHPASSVADVDKAFAAAKRSGKPVFLYWGAVWCPPCNQVKATLFSRPDFVERSKAFVLVYVDGDRPGAQQVAARFKVQGYPTMIVFRPDGTEITRLPGEVDPERYLMTMTAGMNAEVPVRDLVRRVELRESLTPEQWRLLAYYSWDTDEQQVFTVGDLGRKLANLASAAPPEQPLVRDRLALKALVASARADSKEDPGTSQATRLLVERVVADAVAFRQLSDLVASNAELIVKQVSPAGDIRRSLAARLDKALELLAQDASLSRADQIDLLDSRIAMWKLLDDSDILRPVRQTLVIQQIAKVVSATTDRYERQAVVPNAAHVLAAAGLLEQSDELLRKV